MDRYTGVIKGDIELRPAFVNSIFGVVNRLTRTTGRALRGRHLAFVLRVNLARRDFLGRGVLPVSAGERHGCAVHGSTRVAYS